MDDLAKQIDELRHSLGETAYNAAMTLQNLDTALVENDNHLLNYAHSMFERHRQRQQALLEMLIKEARRLAPATPPAPPAIEPQSPDGGEYPRFIQGHRPPGVAQDGRAH